MARKSTTPAITASLEDYLETIFEFVRDRRFARVRDIAAARGVKASSVTPALKRLAEMGLINYERREYIDLTPEGEAIARRVLSRHHLLRGFFEEVLRMGHEAAERDACAIEHHLSDEAMDQMVRFFEFMRACPEAPPRFLQRFHQCARVHGGDGTCDRLCEHAHSQRADGEEPPACLSDLAPGQRGRITRVDAEGERRQYLLDLGLLPDAEVEVLTRGPNRGPVQIQVAGDRLELSHAEAEAVLVVTLPDDPDAGGQASS
jgi:DtxR family Mn-dependent transcriptional regulator